MQNTAQTQNPNGPQFNYPDFSQAGIPTQPVTTPPVQQTQTPQEPTNYINEKKLEELKRDINSLLETPTPSTSSATQSPAPSLAQPVPSTTSAPIVEEKVEEQAQAYVQQPTELPNLTTPSKGQQTWSDSLTKIMPEMNQIKAMQRKEKENNLSKALGNTQLGDSPIEENKIAIEMGIDDKDFSMNALFEEVIEKGASDLHLSVGYPPIIRIDGQLIDIGERLLTPVDVEKLILSVVPDDKKELLEVNREIDFAYSYEGTRTGRFRVNAYYTMKNLAAAFRLIPTRVKTIEELHLPQIYHQITKLKQGLVLVTGPTGHGKSTTLAAMLEDINRNRFDHVITIEDPVEYIFEGKKALIDQREMNDDTNSWAVALRSAMRQDPDVILVGEMRDYETIAAAITLAETGHLVFATLHTNNAAQTIDRVIDVFPENQQAQVRLQLSNILQVVIAQRLIPLDQGGRRAVSEIMFNTPAIANLIREAKTHQIDNIIRTGADMGMVYLEKSLVSLVREGAISAQKAQEYAVYPEEVIRLLKG